MEWTAFNLQKALSIWFSKSEPKHVETLGLAFIAIETMVSIIRSVTPLFGLGIFSMRTIHSSEGVLWQGDGGLVCKFMPCNVTHLWDWCVWLEWGLTDTFTCECVCWLVVTATMRVAMTTVCVKVLSTRRLLAATVRKAVCSSCSAIALIMRRLVMCSRAPSLPSVEGVNDT